MKDAVDELIEHCERRGALSAGLLRVYRISPSQPAKCWISWWPNCGRYAQANGTARHLVVFGTTLDGCLAKKRCLACVVVRDRANNYFPWHERIIVILHPDVNGFFEMALCQADEDFGTILEPRPKDAEAGLRWRRLLLADGSEIAQGWPSDNQARTKAREPP